jgi:hypothetical protein
LEGQTVHCIVSGGWDDFELLGCREVPILRVLCEGRRIEPMLRSQSKGNAAYFAITSTATGIVFGG